MHQPTPAELRVLLALAATAAALYLLAAWLELEEDRQPAGPVRLEDLAPAEIARLMDEARRITRHAAGDEQ